MKQCETKAHNRRNGHYFLWKYVIYMFLPTGANNVPFQIGMLSQQIITSDKETINQKCTHNTMPSTHYNVTNM